MPFIKLSDGTVAHVRMGKPGAVSTAEDVKALEALRDAVFEAKRLRCKNCDLTLAACKAAKATKLGCCPECDHRRPR